MRQELFDELTKLNAERDFSFLLRQVGMFSFTGLSPAQVRRKISILKDFFLAGVHAAEALLH